MAPKGDEDGSSEMDPNIKKGDRTGGAQSDDNAEKEQDVKKSDNAANGAPEKDDPPPSCKKCFVNFAERKSIVCNHEFCVRCWESMVVPDTGEKVSKNNLKAGESSTATPAKFKCSVCGASNVYSRPKSAYPTGMLETLGKGVKKDSQFRCMHKRQKIIPDAFAVYNGAYRDYILVDSNLQEVFVLQLSGEISRSFPYLKNHKFQGGLGLDHEAVIRIALKNEKFSGVSYYKKSGKFKFSAFLYDDTPDAGIIETIAMSPDGGMVVYDSEKMTLCHISKKKLVEVHPLIFKPPRAPFRIKDQNGVTKENESNIEADKEGATSSGDQAPANDENMNVPDDNGEEKDGESKVEESKINTETPKEEETSKDSEKQDEENQPKATEDQEEKASKDSEKQNDGNQPNATGDQQAIDANKTIDGNSEQNKSSVGKQEITVPEVKIKRRSITSVALNSWGQIILCNMTDKCIHVLEKQEYYDSEVGKISLSQWVREPPCKITGKFKCIVDEHDNILLLERFYNTVHRISAEGEYIDALVKFPPKDVTMNEENIVYNVNDIALLGNGSFAVLVIREDGDVVKDDESGEGIWRPEKKIAEIINYSYSTPRKYRRKDQKPICSFPGDAPVAKPNSTCCTVM